MKRIWIILIISMFIISMLPGIFGEIEVVEYTFKAKKFIEDRDVIPIYTTHGLEKTPGGKGKPLGSPPGKNKPPTVTITNPLDGVTVSGIVIITVEVSDKEDDPDPTPIIKINGIQVEIGFTYEWNTELEEDGSYTITAIATDSGGKTGFDSVTVIKGDESNPIDKYALVIGIADYRGIMNDLQYCDDDAIEWENFLQNNGYTVKTLIDRQAKGNNIIAEIDNLLALEDGNDYVVVTYSGHGARLSGYGSCIISYDLYYITHSLFESKFSSADSPHIYFTFDACEIGDFQSLIGSNRVGAFGSNYELSWETNQFENGVFTYYQMEGWYAENYDNFEQDGTYATSNMINWASGYGYTVDPFVEDNYSGDMLP